MLVSYISVLVVDDDGFAVYFLVSEPKTVYLRAVACGDEGMDVIIADKGHERRELILSDKDLDLQVFFSAISTFDLINRAPTHERVHDKLADPFGFIRDDTYPFASVKGGGEVIDRQAVDPCTDDTDDNHAEVIDEERGTADDDTTDCDGSTDIEVQVLINDLTNDVESSGRSIDAEENRLADTE